MQLKSALKNDETFLFQHLINYYLKLRYLSKAYEQTSNYLITILFYISGRIWIPEQPLPALWEEFGGFSL